MSNPIKIPVSNNSSNLSLTKSDVTTYCSMFSEYSLYCLKEITKKLEGIKLSADKKYSVVYEDGPTKAKTVGYGFNLDAPNAEGKYNKALEYLAKKEPAFKSLKIGSKIPIGLAEELLHITVVEKWRQTLRYIDTQSFDSDIENIPDDVKMGLFIICYQNNSLFKNEDFAQAIKAINDGNNSGRKILAEMYVAQICEREDAYKLISRGVIAAQFLTGDVDYKVPSKYVGTLINSALAADPENNSIILNGGNYTKQEINEIANNLAELGCEKKFTLKIGDKPLFYNPESGSFSSLKLSIEDVKGMCGVENMDNVNYAPFINIAKTITSKKEATCKTLVS